MKIRTHIYFSLALIWITAAGAAGAEPAAGSPALPAAPSVGVALLRMIGSLAFVIALFFAGVWAFRNFHRLKPAGSAPRKLQVLEGKTLGPRQAVYVVAYEQQRLLIGATAQGITLLTHLPEGPAETHTDRVVPVSFGEALLQALGRK